MISQRKGPMGSFLLIWIMAPPWDKREVDPTDMLVTLEAEDAFDLTADLHRITAPTRLRFASVTWLVACLILGITTRLVVDCLYVRYRSNNVTFCLAM